MTFSSLGTQVTLTPGSSAWANQVKANEDWLAINRPHARVYNNAAISIPNNAQTALGFNTERVNVGPMHSLISNTGRLAAPAGGGGFYLIGCTVDFQSTATGEHRQVLLRVNGGGFIADSDQARSVTTGLSAISITTAYQLAAGDYVEVVVVQDSGGALNVVSNANRSPEFWAAWLCF